MRLGVYPDHECYDAGRPSWMPYWLDTASENACKWGFYPGANVGTVPTPPAPVIPAPPHPAGVGWTPQQAAAAMRTQYIDEVNQTIDNAITAGTYRPGGSAQISPVLLAWLVGGAALMVWSGKGRRRR